MRAAISILLAMSVLTAATVGAHAFRLGYEGRVFGKLGAPVKRGVAAGPQPTGDILMVDGTSLILQTDGASFVCRAGGC